MRRTQAQELLDDPTYCGQLTMGDFEALLIRAGYTGEQAHEAAMKRGWDRLSTGRLM